MSGTGLAKRLFWVTAGTLAFLVFAAAIRSEATPIRPDLKQILSQSEEPAQFPMARAGWNGPEPVQTSPAESNATLEQIGPAGSARAAHESLSSAAMPDFRAVAGIVLVILLLRRIRTSQKETAIAAGASAPPKGEFPRAA